LNAVSDVELAGAVWAVDQPRILPELPILVSAGVAANDAPNGGFANPTSRAGQVRFQRVIAARWNKK
jgi:hypothetical protein